MKNKNILDSWKDISDYLEKDIRTCRRWEIQLGLPVHRVDENSSHSKVFAYKSEIDQWLEEKARNNKKKKKDSNSSFSINFISEKTMIIVGSIILVVFLLVVVVLLPTKDNSESGSATPRIAVLPFENSDSFEYDEYISEGITSVIISSLNGTGKVAAFPVQSEVQKLENTTDDKNLRKLLSDYILKGNIEKNAQSLEFNIHLVNTRNNKVIYKDKFQGKPEELYSIQMFLCQKILEKMGITNKQIVSTEPSVQTHDAFISYLKANYILNRINNKNDNPWKLFHKGKYFLGKCTRESNELAIDLFNEALKLDNDFAQAYIGLANCYLNYVNFNWDFDIKWIYKAEDTLKKVQARTIDFPDYFTTLITIELIKQIGFNQKIEKDLFEIADEAIQRFPSDAMLNSIIGYCYYHRYGQYGYEKDFDKAIEFKERSFWLFPYELGNIVYIELLMLNKQYYKALEICKMLGQNTNPFIGFRLGEIFYYLGDLEESSKIFKQFYEKSLNYKVDSLLYLGMIASQKGLRNEALKIIDEIERISPKKFIVNEDLKKASIYLGLDMLEMGFNHLKAFFSEPIAREKFYICRDLISIDKNFINVRDKAEFKQIINLKE